MSAESKRPGISTFVVALVASSIIVIVATLICAPTRVKPGAAQVVEVSSRCVPRTAMFWLASVMVVLYVWPRKPPSDLGVTSVLGAGSSAPPALGLWGTSEEALSMDYGRLDTATKGRPSVHAADERGPRGFMHPPLTHSPPWRLNLHGRWRCVLHDSPQATCVLLKMCYAFRP